MKILEVGDVIYSATSGRDFNARYVITRVTPKRAFIGRGSRETAFDRSVQDGRLRGIGGPSGSVWNRIYFYLETEEIKTAFEAKKRRWGLETEFSDLLEDRSNWSNDFMQAIITQIKTRKN